MHDVVVTRSTFRNDTFTIILCIKGNVFDTLYQRATLLANDTKRCRLSLNLAALCCFFLQISCLSFSIEKTSLELSCTNLFFFQLSSLTLALSNRLTAVSFITSYSAKCKHLQNSFCTNMTLLVIKLTI